jgi:hypothetical protein
MQTLKAIRVAVTVLALTVAGLASAQNITGHVVGRVVDAETGKAIAGAVVTATSPSWIDQTVRTNESGYYVIALLPPAHYQVAITAPGYTAGRSDHIQVMIDWRSRSDARLLSTQARAKAPVDAVAAR